MASIDSLEDDIGIEADHKGEIDLASNKKAKSPPLGFSIA